MQKCMYIVTLVQAQVITHGTVHGAYSSWGVACVAWYHNNILLIPKMVKHILVTGASAGIGLALCKLLIRDHDCYVYLGSRNVEKGKLTEPENNWYWWLRLHRSFYEGENALKTILEEVPDKADKIEVLKIDVGDDESVLAAAKILRDRNVKLYGLVNNAGITHKGNEISVVMNTNYNGPKRVTDAFVDLIDTTEGRIVNTSSAAASWWLKSQV